MSNPTDNNVEFTSYQIAGLVPLATFCETNPSDCCDNLGCSSEGVTPPFDNTQPLIGWCVEYTVIEVPASFVSQVTRYCVNDPSDCCPGSGSGSGSGSTVPGVSLNDLGQGLRGHGGSIVGLNVQYTSLQLPEGSSILGKYCVFSPNECCGGSGGSTSTSVSGSIAPSIICASEYALCLGDIECGHCKGPNLGTMATVWYPVLTGVTTPGGSTCDCSQINELFNTGGYRYSLPPLSNVWTEYDPNDPTIDPITYEVGGCMWPSLRHSCDVHDASSWPCFGDIVFTPFSEIGLPGSIATGLFYHNGFWIVRVTFSSDAFIEWGISDADFDCCGVNYLPYTGSLGVQATCDFTDSVMRLTPALTCCAPVPSGSSASGSGSQSGSEFGSSGSGSSSGPNEIFDNPCCVNGTFYQWQVTFSGISGSACVPDPCPRFNTTFILTNTNSTTWTYDDLIGATGIEIILTIAGDCSVSMQINWRFVPFCQIATPAVTYAGTLTNCLGSNVLTKTGQAGTACNAFPATITIDPA